MRLTPFLTCIAALPLCLATGLAAHADQLNCSDTATSPEIEACAEKDLKTADTALNAAYQDEIAYMRSLDIDLPKDQQGAEAALRAAQRAWITYRDQTCLAEGYTYAGGTGEAAAVTQCAARVTQARATELENMGGGD